MTEDFTGCTVIVTGAASGIGAAVAQTLSARGASVVGWDLAPAVADVLEGFGGRGRLVDVTDPGDVGLALDGVLADRGRVDALVNCAGIVRRAEFVDIPLADFETLWRVNVRGTFLPCQAVARAMIASGTRGSIVNFASLAAEQVGATSAAYAATKGAVLSLTRGAAVSLAPHGIRVNAVMPGPVETAMNAELRADPEYLGRLLSRIPLGRQGAAEDIAEAVAFLAGSRSSWITGEVLRVDGGVSVLR